MSNKRNLFVIFIIIFLSISCEEEKIDTKKECNPICKDWETCNEDFKCILKENRCNSNNDCSDNYHCSDNSCKKDIATCDPSCKDWERCTLDLNCVLRDNRCNSNSDCSDNYYCELENTATLHTCIEKAGCNPKCEEWESCNEDLECFLTEGRCNSNNDCADNFYCYRDKHNCVEDTVIECNEDKSSSEIMLPFDRCGRFDSCNDSFDCKVGKRCENLRVDEDNDGTYDGYTRSCCVDGLRGCSSLEESCQNEFDCESGLCETNLCTEYK